MGKLQNKIVKAEVAEVIRDEIEEKTKQNQHTTWK